MIRPFKILPIVLLEIVYNTVWLVVVYYPLLKKSELAGSPAKYIANVSILVILPIIYMPWQFFFRIYILGKESAK